jgi:hypothetical protein
MASGWHEAAREPIQSVGTSHCLIGLVQENILNESQKIS